MQIGDSSPSVLQIFIARATGRRRWLHQLRNPSIQFDWKRHDNMTILSRTPNWQS
jgi:hypothetical protein